MQTVHMKPECCFPPPPFEMLFNVELKTNPVQTDHSKHKTFVWLGFLGCTWGCRAPSPVCGVGCWDGAGWGMEAGGICWGFWGLWPCGGDAIGLCLSALGLWSLGGSGGQCKWLLGLGVGRSFHLSAANGERSNTPSLGSVGVRIASLPPALPCVPTGGDIGNLVPRSAFGISLLLSTVALVVKGKLLWWPQCPVGLQGLLTAGNGAIRANFLYGLNLEFGSCVIRDPFLMLRRVRDRCGARR